MGTDTCIMKLLASLLIAGLAAAQDTTYCNAGWELYTVEWQGQAHHSCFWFGTNYEKATHDSAKLICESMGGFMAEVPYGPHLNNWLVNKLIEKNSSVEWFDWGPNEPNNYRGQNCLTYLQYRDVIFGRYSTFHWNDWDCNEPQDFICEIIID